MCYDPFTQSKGSQQQFSFPVAFVRGQSLMDIDGPRQLQYSETQNKIEGKMYMDVS